MSKVSNSAPSFVEGWRKLPDELKVAILKHALPSGKVFRMAAFHETFVQSRKKSLYPDNLYDARIIFSNQVLPLLACPEISTLALEVFYAHNTLRLVPSLRRQAPSGLGMLIRHVFMSMPMGQTGYECLKRLSNGSLGLHNLAVIEIVIADFAESKAKWTLTVFPPVNTFRLQAKKLIVTCKHLKYLPSQKDPRETDMLDKLTLTSNGVPLKEHTEYFYTDSRRYYLCGKNEAFFVDPSKGDDFEGNPGALRCLCTRKTVSF